MKLLSRNCRGLVDPSAIRPLLELQRQHRPDILFLSETHLDDARGESLRLQLGFEGVYVTLTKERSGGLLLF
jgi:exonuclease III